MSDVVDIVCWRCVKRPVKQLLDECRPCYNADRQREYRARDATATSDRWHAQNTVSLDEGDVDRESFRRWDQAA